MPTYGLSRFLSEWVSPVLQSRDWQRLGADFVILRPNGDAANINFQRSDGSTRDYVLFYVNVGVIPKPWNDYGAWEPGQPAHDSDQRPSYLRGLLRNRIRPPREVSMNPKDRFVDERWPFDSDDPSSIAACGQALAAELGERGAPELERLMDDRAALLGALRPHFARAANTLEVLDMVEAGDADGVRRRLAATPDHPRLAEWADKRLAGAEPSNR